MTQKEKQLLLKDLCARLPYELKYNFGGNDGCDYTMDRVSLIAVDDAFPIEEIKPYLRPMSSMTEEEREEYRKTCFFPKEDGFIHTLETFDFFNKHHFDYRGLIPMGLALEAPEDMYSV